MDITTTIERQEIATTWKQQARSLGIDVKGRSIDVVH